MARWSSWTATRFIQEPLWYFYYMEERFIAVWMMLSIVAEDLWNELKKNRTWGNRDLATDWRLAAENRTERGPLLGSSPYAGVNGQDRGQLRVGSSRCGHPTYQHLLNTTTSLKRAVLLHTRRSRSSLAKY